MNTSTVTPEIATFAEGVRAALADLPAEEVDDLTEGLEADLAESLAEDLRRTLPDPVEYAAELRLAAGLPGPAAPVKRGPVEVWSGVRQDLCAVIQRNPALAATAEFLGVVRPAWWLVRAGLAAWLVWAFLGLESFGWIVWLCFAVISVQWGRGQWRFPGIRGLVAVGNIVAAVALLPVMAAATSSSDGYGYDAGFDAGMGNSVAGGGGEGLFLDGQPLENIYVYDSAGNKLSGVQLFDVDGKPLVPYRNVEETQVLQTPATLETGAEAYNVYPLQVVRAIWDEYGELVPDPNPDPDKAAAYANGPFIKVPAVLAPVVPPPATTPEVVAKPND